jgi:hypothetical protein
MNIVSGTPSIGKSALRIPSNPKSPVKSVSSFAEQLAAVRQQSLTNPKSRMANSQNSATRQSTRVAEPPIGKSTSALPSTPAAPAALSNSANPSAGVSSPDGPLLTEDGYPIALLFYGASGVNTVAPPPPPTPLPTSVDTYWAMQPPAVRVLRDMAPDARADKAQELLQQGYIIDYPIMVEGWGPLKTMLARHNAGYTWVPSFMQTVTQVIPGMTFPGVPTYDPNNPPPRSIPVTVDFARGTSDGPAIVAQWGVKLADAPAT